MGERARILIVDDDETIRKVLKTILSEKGYSVDTAECGEEAIAKTNQTFYNMVLVDMRLPDMEGTKLLTAIKETTPKMVKIIITGYPSLQNAIEAVNKNADAYVLKPVDMDKLLQIIQENLEKQAIAKKQAESKIAEFIEMRVKEIEQKEAVADKRK